MTGDGRGRSYLQQREFESRRSAAIQTAQAPVSLQLRLCPVTLARSMTDS